MGSAGRLSPEMCKAGCGVGAQYILNASKCNNELLEKILSMNSSDRYAFLLPMC